MSKYDADIQKAINNLIEEISLQKQAILKTKTAEIKQKLLSMHNQIEQLKNEISQ